MMITIDNTVMVLVDVQGKLALLMHEHESLFHQLGTMIRAGRQLGLPVIWMEQVPEKMGSTIQPLVNELEGIKPISKATFSCFGSQDFIHALKQTGCRQVLLMGIEAHICVYQTGRDLLLDGYNVEVVVDAVSSRSFQNKQVALDKMVANGAGLTCVEMALFELMKTAENPHFKSVAKLIK